MDSNKIQNSMCVSPGFAMSQKRVKRADTVPVGTEPQQPDSVAFKGIGNQISGNSKLLFSRLAAFMGNPTELASALITFVGTAAIAPLAIMVSPSRGGQDLTPEQKKEKKKFQAYRQPVSALLAFGFQMPTTLGLKMLFDKLAFEKGMFKEKGDPKKGMTGIGEIIPTKKYLAKKAKKILKQDLKGIDLYAHNPIYNGMFTYEELKNELKEKLRDEYKNAKLNVSEETLEKRANKKSRLINLAADKIASKQYKELLGKKIEQLKDIPDFKNIKDIDLVTEEYITLAEENLKGEFTNLRKKHKLTLWDDFVTSIGAETKKAKEFKAEKSKITKEKGLEILKKKEPELFNDESKKVMKYIENRSSAAQKAFSNKIKWITLGTNLVMVAISCIALNWLHPKFVNLLEHIRDKRAEKKAAKAQKVEVRA